MPKPVKTAADKKTAKASPWQQILRDERGRWIKGTRVSASKETAATKSSTKNTSPKSTHPEQEITPNAIMNEKPKEIEEEKVDCPRCGGNMKNKPIRCGPDRVIKVKICGLCNFWVPISQ